MVRPPTASPTMRDTGGRTHGDMSHSGSNEDMRIEIHVVGVVDDAVGNKEANSPTRSRTRTGLHQQVVEERGCGRAREQEVGHELIFTNK